MAIEACTALLDTGAVTGRNVARAYHNRGAAHYVKDAFALAIADFDKAIAIDPRDASSFESRGRAYLLGLRALDKAIADFDEGLRHISPDPGVRGALYFHRGVAYYLKGNNDRAIGDYTRATEIEPGDPRAYHALGLIYAQTRDFDRAIAQFDKAIDVNPDYVIASYDRGRFYVGVTWNPNRALADLDRAIRIKPTYAAAYALRGIIHFGLGNVRQAKKDEKRALRLDPRNTDAMLLSALINIYDGKIDRATTDLSKALSFKPDDAHVVAVLAHLSQNEFERMVKGLERAKQRDPSLESGVEAILEDARRRRRSR